MKLPRKKYRTESISARSLDFFNLFSKERKAMTLTKDVLIEMIRDKVGYPVKEAKEILEMILEEVKLKLEEGQDVKISGFGKWAVREKRTRPGRNPHTGKRIEISARRVVTFHPSDKLRDSVNGAWLAEQNTASAEA
jgi:integration host factor subunit alpha